MTTWFVTRHHGAVMWARDAGIQVTDGGIVRDLDPRQVEAGDLVVGTLPLNLVAEITERGARYLHLAMEVTPEARGRELSADEMRAFGARLEEYDVRRRRTLPTRGTMANAPEAGHEIMICIASAQPQANLLPILARNPKAVYVAVTGDTRAKRTAERIERTLARLEVACHLEDGAPSAPLADMETYADKLLARIHERHPGARIVLNATGGTKLMSQGLANRVGPVGKVIYCDTENDRIEYIQPERHAPDAIPPTLLALDAFLLTQGIDRIRADSDDKDWMARARARRELGRALANYKGDEQVFGMINALAGKAMPKYRKGKLEHPFTPVQGLDPKKPGSKHDQPHREALFDLIAKNELWTREGPLKVRFASENAARYLMGGWLEEYTALEMADLCQRAGIPDGHWAAGIEVRPSDAETAPDKPFNEIDLAVVWRNRLLVIECKTGTQAADTDESMNITNKLDAIRSYLGGPFSSLWLASAREIRNSSVAYARCREFRVDIVHSTRLSEIGNFIAGWMELDDSLGARRDWKDARPRPEKRKHAGAKGSPPAPKPAQ